MPSVAKELMSQELKKTLEAKNYLFFARFSGLSVSDFGELRRKLEKVADRSLVVKNTITRRVFKELGIEADEFVKGSLFLTVANKEPQMVSKILVDFAKDRENFTLLGASLDQKIFQAAALKGIAALPSRQVLLGQLACGLNAPVQGFVSVLNQLVQGLVIALAQIQKQKS